MPKLQKWPMFLELFSGINNWFRSKKTPDSIRGDHRNKLSCRRDDTTCSSSSSNNSSTSSQAKFDGQGWYSMTSPPRAGVSTPSSSFSPIDSRLASYRSSSKSSYPYYSSSLPPAPGAGWFAKYNSPIDNSFFSYQRPM